MLLKNDPNCLSINIKIVWGKKETYGQSLILTAKIWGKKANFHELMFELKGSCWYEPQLKRHQLESSVMKNKYS